MAWDSFKKNLKEAVGRQKVSGVPLHYNAQALLAPLVYIALPTKLGLDNWPGWFTGTLTTWLVGATLGLPGMTSGAIGLGVAHLILSNFHDELTRLFGREPWNFFPNSALQDGEMSQLTVGPGGVLTLPDGSKVMTALPSDTAGSTMHGYYPDPSMTAAAGAGMAGYYPETPIPGMSGYYPEATTSLMDMMIDSNPLEMM